MPHEHLPVAVRPGADADRGDRQRLGDVLGVGEGIETCLAASALHDGLTVWSALNTALLAKFVPAREVRHVVIFADRDVAGLEAAWRLRDELDGRCTVELRTPPAPAKDWADVLETQR